MLIKKIFTVSKMYNSNLNTINNQQPFGDVEVGQMLPWMKKYEHSNIQFAQLHQKQPSNVDFNTNICLNQLLEPTFSPVKNAESKPTYCEVVKRRVDVQNNNVPHEAARENVNNNQHVDSNLYDKLQLRQEEANFVNNNYAGLTQRNFLDQTNEKLNVNLSNAEFLLGEYAKVMAQKDFIEKVVNDIAMDNYYLQQRKEQFIQQEQQRLYQQHLNKMQRQMQQQVLQQQVLQQHALQQQVLQQHALQQQALQQHALQQQALQQQALQQQALQQQVLQQQVLQQQLDQVRQNGFEENGRWFHLSRTGNKFEDFYKMGEKIGSGGQGSVYTGLIYLLKMISFK